jgi:hypothetical protein
MLADVDSIVTLCFGDYGIHFTVSIEDDNKNSKIAPFFLII